MPEGAPSIDDGFRPLRVDAVKLLELNARGGGIDLVVVESKVAVVKETV